MFTRSRLVTRSRLKRARRFLKPVVTTVAIGVVVVFADFGSCGANIGENNGGNIVQSEDISIAVSEDPVVEELSVQVSVERVDQAEVFADADGEHASSWCVSNCDTVAHSSLSVVNSNSNTSFSPMFRYIFGLWWQIAATLRDEMIQASVAKSTGQGSRGNFATGYSFERSDSRGSLRRSQGGPGGRFGRSRARDTLGGARSEATLSSPLRPDAL